MSNPFGPLSKDEFQKAVDAPFGGAATILRAHDPLWGKLSIEGEPVKWKVRVTQEMTMVAYLTVDAVTEKDALLAAEGKALANPGDLSWDPEGEGYICAESAVPA